MINLRIFITVLCLSSVLNSHSWADQIASINNVWFQSGRDAIEQRKNLIVNNSKAKSVIVFIGDGMGIATVTASRIYDGQSRGESGEENKLSFEEFPHVALIKTYNSNQQVPDSAGTASAMQTGVKTRAGTLGVTAEARRGNCRESLLYRIENIAEHAEKIGMSTGIVTTMRVTDATPAAVYAHIPERDWERNSTMPHTALREGCIDIAKQLIEFGEGNGLDVIFGGGTDNFFGKKFGGRRLNHDENLIDEWMQADRSRRYIASKDELFNLSIEDTQQAMGLFSKGHLKFMPDYEENDREPTLSQMTSKAIDLLSRGENGFYLVVEGGNIDKGHHSGMAEVALLETQEFSRAIDVAVSKVNVDETLILVTADHSHVMTMGGYPVRGNPILGLVKTNNESGEPKEDVEYAQDGIPYTTLGYYNGPGAVSGHRYEPDTSGGPHTLQQSLIPTFYHSGDDVNLRETHGGEDVALYAIGPGAHLAGGVLEQQTIFHIIVNALGWEYAP